MADAPELKKAWDNRFIRFLIVGGLNTLVGYALFALLIFAGLHYSLAVFLSTLLGILFNFKTTGSLVFKHSNNRLIFKFVSGYAVVYFLNVGLLKELSVLGFNMYAAGAMLLPPMALVSYFLNSRLVFRGHP
ncbi:MAG: GtrA family protein [Elusimicrobia bacterium]|nr:GtrA family protein [Elusimicrobiota bacterium]